VCINIIASLSFYSYLNRRGTKRELEIMAELFLGAQDDDHVLFVGDAFLGTVPNSPISGASNSVMGRFVRLVKRRAKEGQLYFIDEFRFELSYYLL